ncbi:hypothetical protein DS745_02775 [Anaerobacillus alkaliphilus]|uniref:Uncharacterized protein n=1 Tax=Anaerobacillus alkaliphilus TaxID=1548597 RepID=A0A4V1LGY2_9BACI|nr:hypothetical protein [Anaerobacillus alkaliphilus]RXJ04325.1 hypothetical protein DS745_02775 [Anaerobacillus alkaliphilus]
MRKISLVVEGIIAFIISYLSIFAALAVLPSFLGVIVNIYGGNYQNAGTLFTFLVCAAVLSSNFIIKHLRSLNIIPAK